jgi:hypothetical protein
VKDVKGDALQTKDRRAVRGEQRFAAASKPAATIVTDSGPGQLALD